MSADSRPSLIEKIEALPPAARERVKGYVDALLEAQRSETDQEGGQRRDDEEKGGEEESEVPRFQWRGALSHLSDEYTAEELQEKAIEWRIQKGLDY